MKKIFGIGSLLGLLVACSNGGSETIAKDAAPGVAQQNSGAQARQIFEQRCSVCHGKSGLGDGLAAPSLNPKPRNYTDATWQASVTDDELRKIIVSGGASAGKSAMMPPNPDLQDKPEVVTGLVRIIRAFGKR